MNKNFSIENKNIIILETFPLHGPNFWSYKSVLEARVDIGELEEFPSNAIPGFNERIISWLPSLYEHRCSYGESGGFLRRLEEGTWMGHVLEHVTLELQNLAGNPGGFGRARETSVIGIYKVVVHLWEEDITRYAMIAARDLLLAAMKGIEFDLNSVTAKIRKMADSICLGPSTANIVSSAKERNIPAIRLFPNSNLVQLGYGSSMKRIWTAETDQTSAIAENISRDKNLTKTLLTSCGIPVPYGREVASSEDAWEAANEVGLPVCIKPIDGNHGRGVFMNILHREEIELAFDLASKEGSSVILEKFIPGFEHRVLIVDGKLIAANRSETIKVKGDGVLTISELIDRDINSDPRRGTTELHPLYVIEINDSIRLELARQNLSPESIPVADREVLIQRNANHSHDCTDEVCPETIELCILATKVVGLDIAGIDLVAEDISIPLYKQNGAIVEVNAGPSLLMHIKPGYGKPRPVGRAIVDSLFSPEDNGRIPVIGISGTRGKTTVARILGQCIFSTESYGGIACSDGIYLDGKHIQKEDAANWAGGRRLLLNRIVDLAIIENGARTILGEALPYDVCHIGIVTNIIPELENLEKWDISTMEKYIKVYRTQVDVILKSGYAILNADDKEVAELSLLSEGEVIFFSKSKNNPYIDKHLKEGKRCTFVKNNKIILSSNQKEIPLCRLNEIPLDFTVSSYVLENLLAAISTCVAIGLSNEVILTGIKSYTSYD